MTRRWKQDYRLSMWANKHAAEIIAVSVLVLLAGFSLAMYLIDGVK